jgi:uncharacterized membrane protein YphA (DoxX/SURF4 family)
MSSTEVQTTPRWQSVALWIVKGLLAAIFFAAGGAKLYGVPMMVETFEHIGLGQGFRYVTGLLEVVGGVAILVPSVAAFGALLLSCIMVGAVVTHLVIGGSAVPAIVLLLLTATVAFVHRGQIGAVFDPNGSRA